MSIRHQLKYRLSKPIPENTFEHRLLDSLEQRDGEGVLVVLIGAGVPTTKCMPRPVFAHNFSNSLTKYDLNSYQTQWARIVATRTPKSDLAYIKVLGDNDTGTTTSIERGIQQATRQWCACRKNYLRCVLCFAIVGEYDPDLEDAFDEAILAGITVLEF